MTQSGGLSLMPVRTDRVLWDAAGRDMDIVIPLSVTDMSREI